MLKCIVGSAKLLYTIVVYLYFDGNMGWTVIDYATFGCDCAIYYGALMTMH